MRCGAANVSTVVAERPTYPPALAEIIDRLGDGGFLQDICSEEGMPDRRTVQRWMKADPDLAAEIARARARAAEADEREVARITAGVLDGTFPPDAARVALSGRMWLAKVRAPKVYGDKLEIEARVQVVPVLNVTVPGRVIDVTPGAGNGQ